MNELIKELAPPIIFIWYYQAVVRRTHNYRQTLSLLLLFSLATSSQNFQFYYREIHQTIQATCCFALIIATIQDQKLTSTIITSIVFGIVLSISLTLNVWDEDGVAQFINYISVSLAAAQLTETIEKPETRPVFEDGAILLGTALGLLAILEFATTREARIEGLSANPNYFAYTLCFCFAVCVHRHGMSITNPTPIIIIIAIVLTGSRAGIAMAMITTVWWCIARYGTRSILPVVISALAIATTLTTSNLTRFSSVEQTEGSDAERTLFRDIALAMASDHPYIGVGWGRYIAEFSNYTSYARVLAVGNDYVDAHHQERRVTHNDFLRLLAELGYFITAVCAIYLTYAAHSLWRNRLLLPAWLPPLWLGTLFFSATHNNMNSALFWTVILLARPTYHLKFGR